MTAWKDTQGEIMKAYENNISLVILIIILAYLYTGLDWDFIFGVRP